MLEYKRINKFTQELKNYKIKEVQNYPNNKSVEQMTSEIKSLMQKHDLSENDFKSMQVVFNQSSADMSRTEFSKTIAVSIDKEKQRRLERNKNLTNFQKNSLKEQEDKHQETTKKKPVFNFNLVSIGKMGYTETKEFFKNLLQKQGYTQIEINTKPKNFNILDFNDKAIQLDINTNNPFVDQLAEASKKLYNVLVNGKSVEETRKLNPSNIKEEVTTLNLDLPGNEKDVKGTILNDNNPNEINVSTSKNGIDVENTPDNDLTEKDKAIIGFAKIKGIGTHEELWNFLENTQEGKQVLELYQEHVKDNDLTENDDMLTADDNPLTEEDLEFIDLYGIEGMKNHNDIVNFMNSEEWELIQQMQTNALTKSDDTPK